MPGQTERPGYTLPVPRAGLILASVLACATALTGCSAAQGDVSSTRTVTVTRASSSVESVQAAAVAAARATPAAAKTAAARATPAAAKTAAARATPAAGKTAAARSTAAARTTPAATPTSSAPSACARNHLAKAVLVSVARQHAWLCARQRVVYNTAVTTGAVDLPYDSTPTGTFHVQSITRNQVLTLLSGAQYTVKYWIPFDAPLFGFHDSPWQKMPYGSQKYRTKGSHGCVHMPLAAIKYLATWASVGTTVRVKG